MKLKTLAIALLAGAALATSTVRPALATETENLGLAVLPAPGSVTIDGRAGDWDLSGGIFVCGDVEGARDAASLWYHAMYDADNLYLLARWNDPTPLNNPGVTSGDMGFAGDCLQTRVITAVGQPDEKTMHLTCWRGKDGRDVIKVELGRNLQEGIIVDLKALGAKQAFTTADDGKHYVQEIALPWAQLARSGKSPGPGAEIRLAIEANFTVGVTGRLTLKDCFQTGVTLDRVFTFMASNQWGSATLERKGHISPRPVRLSDGREFAVRMEAGLPVVDWTGLEQKGKLAGFKSLALDMPEDGYASVVLRSADGTVARHLLNCQPLSKGHHDLKWDGLTTPNWRQPGEVVAPGTYQASALYHTGIGLRLKGWAANSGQTPWDYPAHTGNWGGDHGTPAAVVTDEENVYLGWTFAESGKALVACDLEGRPVWHHTRSMGGARAVALDGGTVYVLDQETLYRLDKSKGQYSSWQGKDRTELPLADLLENFKPSPDDRFSLTGGAGKVYLGSKLADQIVVFDAATGAVQKRIGVTKPLAVTLAPSGQLYVVSEGKQVIAFDKDSFRPNTVVNGLSAATSIAVDAQGQMYVGVGDPDNQIKVFSAAGKPLKAIGRLGDRALLGPWTPDGVRFVDSLALDAKGQLWVMENDWHPKRVSVWNVETGQLIRELFGATGYGALGGAICPDDPLVVVGQSCEWRIDPQTGHATCTAVITRDGMEVSRFVSAPDGRTYLYVASTWAFAAGPLRIFQRLGDGQYKLRATIFYADENGNELPIPSHGQPSKNKKTMIWSDANDDAQRQPNEISGVDGEIRFSAWAMWVTPDGTLYAKERQHKILGFTPCGAPRYDLANGAKMPAEGLGSADGRTLFAWGEYGRDRSWCRLLDIASGKQLWQYPDTFVGVHGSHNAPPPEIGLIRGSFPPCGTAKLPEPIGNVWIIPTNVGEWHILTEQGFYLTRLFQPDPLKVKWPEAKPGAVLDEAASGGGGEDFGGSATLGRDGKLYLEAGHTAYWDLEVVGLETVKALPLGSVTIDAADLPLAKKMREDYLQAEAAIQPLVVKKRTPNFTGNLDQDFAGTTMLKFQKQEDARVQATATWDDQNLYLGWDVHDATPWVNGATDRDLLYLGGDTVDFQLATDPAADPKRDEAARGDLRLSIGPLQGKPQAVLYRRVADEKHPRSFNSGTVAAYVMESVVPLEGAEILAKTWGPDRYVVEAKVPLAVLGLKPQRGLELHGDFGATHGDPAGQRTRLRTYWANQHTGIVDDAVYELKMEPRLWGTFLFTD